MSNFPLSDLSCCVLHTFLFFSLLSHQEGRRFSFIASFQFDGLKRCDILVDVFLRFSFLPLSLGLCLFLALFSFSTFLQRFFFFGPLPPVLFPPFPSPLRCGFSLLFSRGSSLFPSYFFPSPFPSLFILFFSSFLSPSYELCSFETSFFFPHSSLTFKTPTPSFQFPPLFAIFCCFTNSLFFLFHESLFCSWELEHDGWGGSSSSCVNLRDQEKGPVYCYGIEKIGCGCFNFF